jgi:hypothetical protein
VKLYRKNCGLAALNLRHLKTNQNIGLSAGLGMTSESACGEVPEWSNGAVSKTVVGASLPRVRIPVCPPFNITMLLILFT